MGEGGWILLEVTTAIPIALLIFLGALATINAQLSSFECLSRRCEQQFFARASMGKITQDFKQCVSYAVFNNGRGLKLVDSNGSELNYYLNNGQIYRSIRGSSVPISEKTSSMIFYDHGSQTLGVELVMNDQGQVYTLNQIVSKIR